MAEVKGVGGGVRPPSPENQTDVGARLGGAAQGANAQQFSPDATIGPPGVFGQPTGLPIPGAEGQKILPDVLAGLDPSQIAAARQVRTSGTATATEALLGLDQQPTMRGAFLAPPGNSEALRHMTPLKRRTIMHGLLKKQRVRLRSVVRFDEGEDEGGGGQGGNPMREPFNGELSADFPDLSPEQLARARRELRHVAGMLNLLNEMLSMQDYVLSHVGTRA